MSAVARRYAKALFALAKEAHTLEPTADQLGRLAAVAADPTVGPVLRNPLLSPGRRRELAAALARELALPETASRFLGLLAEHQRLGEVWAIADHFQKMLDRELGRVRVTVRTALPLDAQQQADIVARFSQLTGKQVIPSVQVDASLLGGVVVEAEGKVYDGSVRTHLERLATALSGGGSH